MKNITAPLPLSESVILDIDLDYFSCMDYPWTSLPDRKIEICQTTYERLLANKYHALWLNSDDVSLYHEDERYYLLADAQLAPNQSKREKKGNFRIK